MRVMHQVRLENRATVAYVLRQQPVVPKGKKAVKMDSPHVYKDIDTLLRSREVLTH